MSAVELKAMNSYFLSWSGSEEDMLPLFANLENLPTRSMYCCTNSHSSTSGRESAQDQMPT